MSFGQQFAYSKNKEQEIALILAAEVQDRTENCFSLMSPFMSKHNNGGINIIDLDKTREKLMVAVPD